MAFSRRRRVNEAPVPEPERQSIHAIIGGVQSGKTAAIIDRILATQHLCVVVVRNVCTDVFQFVSACRRSDLPVRTYASDRALSAGENSLIAPRVVVLLANATNVRNCAKDLIPLSMKFSLIIDEADKIMFGDESGERSFRAEMDRFSPYATELVLVTATTFNFMKLPEYGGRITADNTTIVQRRSNYCGMEDIEFGLHGGEGEEEFIEDDTPNPDSFGHVMPGSFKAWVRSLSSDDDREMMREIGQPKIALARLGNTINTIISSAREARRISPEILTVIFTGDGVAVPRELHSAMSNTLTATRWKRAPDFKLVSKLNLQQTLSLLRDSDMFDADSTILVCAGILAARGVNFCDSGYLWALTHEYYLAAKTTKVTDLHQGMRLLGNKPWSLDIFRPRLMTKRCVMEDILIGKAAHDQVVQRMLAKTSRTLMHAVTESEIPEKPSVRYADNLMTASIPVAKRMRSVDE